MKLVIRADADSQIGTGHIMRCLALAQAWQDRGGQPVFVTAALAPALAARLNAEGMEVVRVSAQPGSTDDALQAAQCAHQQNAPWIVLDGYHFGASYQRALKDSGLRLLFLDDMGHADHYYADVVLNQNICADEGLYANREPSSQLLLGTRYALLRREFLRCRQWTRNNPEIASKVLITLGGSDAHNVTLLVIRALQRLDIANLEAIIVVGPANPALQALNQAVPMSACKFKLLSNVSNMPELMAWADIAISAGGITCWELAFMGLPNLVLVLASNQAEIAAKLEAQGVAVNLGWHTSVSQAELAARLQTLVYDPSRRGEMSTRGRHSVDGCGAARVVAILTRATSSTKHHPC